MMGSRISRRRCLAAGLLSGIPTYGISLEAPRLNSPVRLSPDDIGWFRTCRSEWVDGENGAPGIFGGEVTIDNIDEASQETLDQYEKRLEPILCAFFMHASFSPGRYACEALPTGKHIVDVTADDITIMRQASWRTFAIDNKRPYGDFTNYPIDMARALGIPIGKDPVKGHATIPEAEDARMVALHEKSRYVLQAYIEHAALQPGEWFVPQDGWGGLIFPRCRPVGSVAIAAYRTAVAASHAVTNARTLRFEAQQALFNAP